jgi:hypothetical protein
VIAIDSGIFQREVLFLLGAGFALALFLVVSQAVSERRAPRKDGTSRASRDELPEHLRALYAFSDDWEGDATRPFPVSLRGLDAHLWEVSLFGSRELENLRAVSFDGARYFELGNSAKESVRILTPLVRKVVARFRAEFEQARPIVHIPPLPLPKKTWKLHGPFAKTATPEPPSPALLSWLSSERHIHHVSHWFLRELHQVAREARVTPSLTVSWEEGLVLSVRMPFAHELSVLSDLAKNNECIGVAITREEVVVDLWVAFPPDSATNGLFRTGPFRVTTRDKRSAS